jgi:SAM-dependent methyltransferase
LLSTGTLGGSAKWQQWLYRGKTRAYMRALNAETFSYSGARILNFGCGGGYFEDVWESLGAAPVAGIDLVESVIEGLRKKHPRRQYRYGDLARDANLLDGWSNFDLVTAIDVLYHIVDDADVQNVIARLSYSVRPGGLFLFTDRLTDLSPAPHVRFRSMSTWQPLLNCSGLTQIRVQPVFVAQNRPGLVARYAPLAAGLATYSLDAVLTVWARKWANNFVVICRKNS